MSFKSIKLFNNFFYQIQNERNTKASNLSFRIWLFSYFVEALRGNKGQKRHVPGLFKRLGYHALVLGAGAGAVVGQNFGMRRHKAPQGLRIFVVYGADFVAAKIALFFNLGLAVSVSVVVRSHKKSNLRM
jgi:hypothetical protein